MFLRSITIRGFKSFAEKTVLEFTPGVSVIVGPNGSGKSNLVDAISWALGEQGARALRGGHMADVIFAGTPSRPALGMAEVKLVIDNSAGKIPVPMSEIEVSRTIFRSGESEYRINGQLVRLLDVQELLSESGIGRGLHTVVGQGQLEEVLLAKPEDRRKYIEEAAGIAKYRRRKERAERKLDGLEQDLLRLQDVLGELRRQLKPLQQQAEMASKHEQLTTEAEQLSAKLAAARLRALLREKERRVSGWDEGLEKREAARARLDALDDQVLAAADDRAAAVGALSGAEQVFRQIQFDRASAERAYRESVERESVARERIAQQATRAARVVAVDEELGRVEEELSRLLGELRSNEDELERAEFAFRAAEEDRRRIEDVRRRIGEDAAARRAEVSALRDSLAAGEHERGRLDGSLKDIRSRIEAIEWEREGLAAEIERLDGQSSPLTERRVLLEQERRAIVEKLEELEDIRRRHESRRDLLEARRRDIEETPGSRFIGSHKGRAIGLLKDLIHIDKGLERALEAALGQLADAVVYDDAERALADVPNGDGAILAIASGGPVPLGIRDEHTLLSVVDAEPSARGIAGVVLRGIYLASTVEEAAEKQRLHPAASFVTPEGVLVGPAVIHTAREADARAREIRAELQVIAHDLSATMNAIKPRTQRLEEMGHEIDFLREQVEASDAEITAAAERASLLERDLSGLGREEELVAQRLSALDETVAISSERLTALGPAAAEEMPELPPMPSQPIQVRVTVETLRRERTAHDARLHALRAERDALAADDPAELRAELEAAELAHTEAELAAEHAETAAAEAAVARDGAADEERIAAEREAQINKAWREASTELDRLRQHYEEEDRLRGDIERRIGDAERLIRQGHQSDPAELLATIGDEDSVDTLEKRSELVQRRLALLGRVNLLATGEFQALQERHDFMARELDDVRKARRDLLEVVAKVDREITETFTAAYQDVAMQFEVLIKELFPGGEGRLVLTDPAQPLTSGIEIEASPGRKRVKRISLLSGGERSLTALAYLFAIFTARPSPFYLMDEVEPALDDVNLHRFLRLVEGFARDSQVLIVTHQKRTMEIAGMMYGISLNKDGTTKVVCQRLDHQTALEEDARLEGERERADGEAVVVVQTSADEDPLSVEVPQPEPVR
ncbi:MAG: chromosome segregation protein SMC [Actinomycetota bacterium]|nr:chromosome segregation protein SMC [Actinomycetota bacterium]